MNFTTALLSTLLCLTSNAVAQSLARSCQRVQSTVDLRILENEARSAGLHTGADAKTMIQRGWLQPGHSVLDIEPGTGRFLKQLWQLGYSGRRSALATSGMLTEHLYQIMGVRVIDAQQLTIPTNPKYDRIVWTLGRILSASPEERLKTLASLKLVLTAEGSIIVEHPEVHSSATSFHELTDTEWSQIAAKLEMSTRTDTYAVKIEDSGRIIEKKRRLRSLDMKP